jgi:hypothetical protein
MNKDIDFSYSHDALATIEVPIMIPGDLAASLLNIIGYASENDAIYYFVVTHLRNLRDSTIY